jgi:nucleotide-binding universal stress UspA family protein
VSVKAATRYGTVVEEIVNYAQDERMDMILMTTRARAGASRMFRGSIAEKVMHKSRVPVVLVKPTPAALAKRSLQKFAAGVAK